MSKPRLGSTSKEKVDEKCKSCDQKVTSKEKAIQCEICEGWWHCKCEKISDEGYVLLNCENIHWFCGACRQTSSVELDATDESMWTLASGTYQSCHK